MVFVAGGQINRIAGAAVDDDLMGAQREKGVAAARMTSAGGRARALCNICLSGNRLWGKMELACKHQNQVRVSRKN